MMMGMVELGYILTKALHTLNAKISIHLFPVFLNIYFVQFKIIKIAYLMGDYNINLLNIVTHQKTNDFIDNEISQGFIPHTTDPTRITSNSATRIYQLYSIHNHPKYESGIIVTDVADHFCIFHIIYGTRCTIYYMKYTKTSIYASTTVDP